MEERFRLQQGDGPVLVSVPHAGTGVPADIGARFSDRSRRLPDTDWYVDRLYDFVPHTGAGLLVATHSRYVIDLNRPPDDAALYATPTTGLVPLATFSGHAIYQPGLNPDAAEIAVRRDRYWRPYHAALAAELGRIRDRHGHVVLLDAHSIRSRVPMLFDGRLPDLNLGSNGGRSSAPGLIAAAMDILETAPDWSAVLDGRFRGGFITRHYGRPHAGTHALQLEMAQSVYMRESPPRLHPDAMTKVQGVLRLLLEALQDWRPGHG